MDAVTSMFTKEFNFLGASCQVMVTVLNHTPRISPDVFESKALSMAGSSDAAPIFKVYLYAFTNFLA